MTPDYACQEPKVTKQVVINTQYSVRLIPITAYESSINEIQSALTELEELKKAIEIIKKHGVIKFSNGNLQNDFPVFEKAKNLILKGRRIGK
jgi:chaperonin cofactor prefoldin